MAQTNESQEQVTVNVETLQPVTRTLMTIGALPTSYLISMTYEEQLLWLQNYLIKTVIPAINNNAEATQEVQDIVMALQDYINTQFSELNLQEYVDNKLDEMLESGVFENILMDYVQLTKVYDTYNDMIFDASTFTNGMKLKTMGYNFINDGGGAEYVVTNVQNGNKYQVSIGTNLWVEMIDTDTIYVEQFGAYGDKINDDSTAVQNAINYGASTHKNIVMNKSYLINTPITITRKDGFKILGNQQRAGHVTANEILAPNGFLVVDHIIKMSINGLAIDSGENTAIEFTGSENRWNNVQNCIIKTTGIGINAKNLYYSTIENCRFNTCTRAIVIGENGTGAGDITIKRCHFPANTTVFYIDTDSLVTIDNSTTENVGTICYLNHGGVFVNNCYMSDGFKQGFIVNNGNLHLNTVTGLVSTRTAGQESEFGTDRYCIKLDNEAQLFLNDISFTEYYSDAPEIIINSDSASMYINNDVKFLGYYLLETNQTNIIAPRQQNYITSKVIEGTGTTASGTSRAFKVTETLIKTNYMGDSVYKYTNDSSTPWAMQFNYKVPKAGYYLFWLKLIGASQFNYDYVVFPNTCYIPSTAQMSEAKYKKTNSRNWGVNAGSEHVIRPITANYPNSTVCVPIYIDSNNLEGIINYYSQQNQALEEKTIDYIGLTDFENPFCLPCFK